MADEKGSDPGHLAVEDRSLFLAVTWIGYEHVPYSVGFQHSAEAIPDQAVRI